MQKIKICAFAHILLVFLGGGAKVTAQTESNFFNSKEKVATWLGLDFTQLKIFGDYEADTWKIANEYLWEINDLVVREPDKYFVKKAFRLDSMEFDLEEIKRLNDQIDHETLLTLKSADIKKLSLEEAQEIVDKYELTGKSGVGIVFIVVGFNKSSDEGIMYVTIVDLADKKVLMTKRMVGKPGGFGWRNYWARTVYEVLKSIEKSEYNKWKSGK